MGLTKPCVDHQEVEAVKRVLESGWLTEGKITYELEQRFAEYIGCKYAIAVSNCTTALTLCLRAYEIQGEVVIPDFTHPATAQAVLEAGCTPILADVNSLTRNLLPTTPTVSAVMPVSWAGHPLTELYEAPVIEDAACSLGSEYLKRKTGSTHTSCFSFHPRKLITCGEGGIITTNNAYINERLRSLKNFGESSKVLLSQKWDGSYDILKWMSGKVDFKGRGINAKLSDVQAAIALTQLNKLPEIIKDRRAKAKVYNDLLSHNRFLVTPHEEKAAFHSYQTYAVQLKRGNRDIVIARLAKKGIETQIGTYALHRLTAFRMLRRFGSLKNSDMLFQSLLALPMAYDLTEEDQKFVASELAKCLS